MIELQLEKSLFGPEGKMKLAVSCQIAKGELIGSMDPPEQGNPVFCA